MYVPTSCQKYNATAHDLGVCKPCVNKYLNYHRPQTPVRTDQPRKKPAQVLISPQTSRISATANDALLTHDTTEDQTGACMRR
jgi:hypothetical protein